MTPRHSPLYGLMAEFEDPNQLVAAAHRGYDGHVSYVGEDRAAIGNIDDVDASEALE